MLFVPDGTGRSNLDFPEVSTARLDCAGLLVVRSTLSVAAISDVHISEDIYEGFNPVRDCSPLMCAVV